MYQTLSHDIWSSGRVVFFANIMSILIFISLYSPKINGGIICFLKVAAVPLLHMVLHYIYPRLIPNISPDAIMYDIVTGKFGSGL